jgi:hypothetical protein
MISGQIELYKPTAIPYINLPIAIGIKKGTSVNIPPNIAIPQITSKDILLVKCLIKKELKKAPINAPAGTIALKTPFVTSESIVILNSVFICSIGKIERYDKVIPKKNDPQQIANTLNKNNVKLTYVL